MDIKQAIAKVIDGHHLDEQEMTAVMRAIMGGKVTGAQIAGLLVALRMKGETVIEIAAAAAVMRELASGVNIGGLSNPLDIGPRKELGVRTIFNILGSLSNPAGVPNQLLGVFRADLLEPLAQALQRLGSRHLLVVHSRDGLDEISIGDATEVVELKNGEIRRFSITPEDFGISRAPLDAIRVEAPQASLTMLRDVLENRPGPARDIVVLNAGAAIYVAGVAASLEESMRLADAAITGGEARNRLERLVTLTRGFR